MICKLILLLLPIANSFQQITSLNCNKITLQHDQRLQCNIKLLLDHDCKFIDTLIHTLSILKVI